MYENPTSIKQAPFDPMIPETCPVSVDDLGRYVAENHFNANNKFKEQFKVCDSQYTASAAFTIIVILQSLYTGDEKSCDYGQREEFKLLNRFKNITVCESICLLDLIVHTYGVGSNDSLSFVFTGP